MDKKQLLFAVLLFLFVSTLADARQTPLSETVDSWHTQALGLKNQGKYEEAEILFEKIINADPDNANAYFDLGNLYCIEKKYDAAISCYKKAIGFGLPQELMDMYHFNLSVCYTGLGDYEGAISSLQECLTINPKYEGAKELLDMVTQAYQRGETEPFVIDL